MHHLLILAIFTGGAVTTTWVGGLIVDQFIAPYSERLNSALQRNNISPLERGFANGGVVIGWLERFLIYLFVLCDQLAGVGFLVAAKGVFRFGELRENQNRLEAEYITIGTLMSFSWGLASSLLSRLLINIVSS